MNHQQIRQDFPALKNKVIYFDNACMSLKPKQVISAIKKYYQDYPACGSRSLHRWGKIVTDKCEEARKLIANFIKAKRMEEIVFTKNTSEALNLVAQTLDFKTHDQVITSNKEHNSSLLCWQILFKEKKLNTWCCLLKKTLLLTGQNLIIGSVKTG